MHLLRANVNWDHNATIKSCCCPLGFLVVHVYFKEMHPRCQNRLSTWYYHNHIVAKGQTLNDKRNEVEHMLVTRFDPVLTIVAGTCR